MSKEKQNLSESIYYRLKNFAKSKKQLTEEILRYYVMERFLYRLSKSEYQHKFFLKGGLIFRAWDFDTHRPTMDIDFLAKTSNSVDNIKRIIEEICAQQENMDGISFDLSKFKLTKMQVEGKYQGVRAVFHASLHTAKIQLQLDIGFNDEIYEPQLVIYPTILDLPSPELKGYSFESVIAEKFEAIVKLGKVNTRMKDFFDIWKLSKQFSFNGDSLLKAFSITFKKRRTPIKNQPESFKETFYMNPSCQKRWLEFLKTIHCKEEISLSFVIQELIVFLNPLVDALISEKSFSKIWEYDKKWIKPKNGP